MYTLNDLNFIPNKYAYCPQAEMTLMEHKSYSVIIKKVTLKYNIKDEILLLDGRKLPCNIDDSFCEPTTRHPSTLVWFPETQCVIFEMARQFAKLTKGNER